MKITHEEKDFYAIYDAPQTVRAYLKYSVPPTYRRYESEPVSRWLVHSKYVDYVRQLGNLAVRVKRDPYEILFLTKGAPRFMISAAWKALALQYHPDRGGDPEKFLEIKEAYEELMK